MVTEMQQFEAPEQTPLDFCLWGWRKSEVYNRNVNTRDEYTWTVNFIFMVLCIVIHILIRSNKMQQYAGIYLQQNYSTCFGCLSHPSSGVHQTVTAASGTGNITFHLLPAWPN